uniref:Uncharacterized protein n=1 Tax=Hanusia phi TaxID=3032 RepID=A0A7S0F2A5_9CRYP
MYGRSRSEDKQNFIGAFKADEDYGMGVGGTTVNDCSKLYRLGFLRKVYGILTIQLVATAVICAMAMRIPGQVVQGKNAEYTVLAFGSFLAGSKGFQILVFILSIGVLLWLMFKKDSYPTNMILLSGWTVMMAMTVATACSITVCDPLVIQSGNAVPLSMAGSGSMKLYGGSLQCAMNTPHFYEGSNAVLMALGITASVFFSLTAFTLQSKWDFSFLGAGLFAATWILVIWGFMMMIFGGGANLRYLYSLAGSVIFSLYIVFDTWMITNRLGPDDYIIAAIDLYLDVINLFIFILQLLRRD